MTQEHVVQQAGQLVEGPVRCGVFRTLTDQDGPFAVLRIGLTGAEVAHEVTLRPGEQIDLEELGLFTLLATAPSTRERRGSVRFTVEWEDRNDREDREVAGGGNAR